MTASSEPYTRSYPAYDYKPISTTFTNWRTQTHGCIEERQTSNAHDFSNFSAIDVNTTYLDLNLDLVPTAGVPATQWKPAYPRVVYLRGIDWYGGGTPSPAPISSIRPMATTCIRTRPLIWSVQPPARLRRCR